MEVIIPNNHNLFDFNSPRSSPLVSPPSTPKPFGGSYYFSAPASPSHLSQVIYDDRTFHENGLDSSSSANNEAGDGRSIEKKDDQDFDFAFDVAASEDQWETSSVSAEELFHGGVIKPLNNHPIASAKTVIPKKPLANTDRPSHERAGRERQPSRRARSAARSLSPTSTRRSPPQEISTVCSVLTTVKRSGSNKKWSFKDFFLFRSASEGRASERDPLKKYTEAVLRPAAAGSRRRGGPAPPVSPHERHYTVNRAVSEDMKRKTFLPYKQGILGRLAFNPAVHALANGFGFSRK